MLNRKDFSKWLKERVGCPYLWGGQGESIYGLIKKLAQQKGQGDDSTTKMLAFLEKNGTKDQIFYDCSGLGVAYLLKKGVLKVDTTAAGLYDKCKPVDAAEVVEGDWGFLKKSGKVYHVGYVVDNDMIVHAYNQEKGVIIEKRTARQWIYARPEFAFDFSDVEKKETAVEYVVKSGDTLGKIAKKYNTSVDNIVKANRAKYPKITANHIVTGWKLVIK